MASKSERLITEALGHPDSDNAVNVTFTSASASGVMTGDTTYRVVATEDCYLRFGAPLSALADSNDMLLLGGIPEVFVTTASITNVHVIRKDTDGVLQLTPMLTRGK